MTRRPLMLITIVFTLCAESQSVSAEVKPGLRAGAYAMDVTPEYFPISVNGGMADRQAQSAHDPLHARCLVLDDGQIKLAIVVVDSCMIPRELVENAKAKAAAKTGIPTSNMLISATHTHTAPTVGGVFQSEPDKRYVAYLTDKIAAGIEKAASNMVPAAVGWGVEQEPSQLFNRRWRMKPGTIGPDPFGNTTDRVKMNPGIQNPALVEPAGPIDPDVSVLSVQTLEGRPLALLANYSLHYVGDLPPLSADYFGVFAEKIGPMIGADDKEPRFVGILSNGTSGDVNNINFREPARKTLPGERCRTVAEIVAVAAKKAHAKATHRTNITLAVAEKDIKLGVRKPSAVEIQRAKDILAKVGERVLQGLEEVYARETVLLADYPNQVPIKLQAMRIGELGIVAIPCEVFTEIGLTIKAKSPLKPTFTIELANGYNGYLPTPEQHKLGGYETWRARSSYLEVNASEAITTTVLDLLNQVAK
jgi:neutral ceramidase